MNPTTTEQPAATPLSTAVKAVDAAVEDLIKAVEADALSGVGAFAAGADPRAPEGVEDGAARAAPRPARLPARADRRRVAGRLLDPLPGRDLAIAGHPRGRRLERRERGEVAPEAGSAGREAQLAGVAEAATMPPCSRSAIACARPACAATSSSSTPSTAPRSAASTCARSRTSASSCCPRTPTSRASCARMPSTSASTASSTSTSTTPAS